MSKKELKGQRRRGASRWSFQLKPRISDSKLRGLFTKLPSPIKTLNLGRSFKGPWRAKYNYMAILEAKQLHSDLNGAAFAYKFLNCAQPGVTYTCFFFTYEGNEKVISRTYIYV